MTVVGTSKENQPPTTPTGGTGYDYDPATAFSATEDGWIDFTQSYVTDRKPECGTPRSMYRAKNRETVWYCGWDGYIHAFLNPKIYFSWYADFSGVKIVTDDDIALMAKGEPVQYRPGVRLVKKLNDATVYAVVRDSALRAIPNEAAARALYGADWAKRVDNLQDKFFKYYVIADPIKPTGTR